MISVIICSIDANALRTVDANIAATIGVPFEVIGIDNARGERGICAVYNEGVARARYDLLCLMHEDIEMKTLNWGAEVIKIFKENPDAGLLGIAGGGYKSLTPSSWYNYHLQENGGFYANLIQGFRHAGKPSERELRNPKGEELSRVACIDGCWMCTPRSVALEHGFDEKLLQKFHGYDLDYSLAVGRKKRVFVTFNILLAHFSEGNFNHTWMEEIFKIHLKWADVLPVNIDGPAPGSLKRIERDAYLGFLQRSLNQGYTKATLARLVLSTRRSRITTLSFPYKLLISLLKMKPEA